ncbi:MAG: hypothetical protein K9M97_02795 [Akkermansiaceae bacterium]|nr:hypothetical protein [Akkermansiaceae bacterium]
MDGEKTYGIKITVTDDRSGALQDYLNDMLTGDGPVHREVVLTYEDIRNRGSTSGDDERDLRMVLSDAARAFPGSLIELTWRDEHEQEGGQDFFVSPESESEESDGEDGEDQEETSMLMDFNTAERILQSPTFDLSFATMIVAEAVKVSAQHHEHLYLDGLTEISEEVADVLAKALVEHNGCLSLDGLDWITGEVARALSAHQGGLSLNGLTEMPDEVAKMLAAHQGTLYLNGMASLSDKAAMMLSAHQGDLSLNGMSSLSDEAIKTLSAHKGYLGLDGIASLSDEAAQALASHQGKVSLWGLKEFSPEGARALLKHGNVHTMLIDLFRRDVMIEEVIGSCGPLYRDIDAIFSFSARADGWQNAVKTDRVLSWSDYGFGIVGNRVVDVAFRLVATKPMTAYRDANIQGSVSYEDFVEVPEGFYLSINQNNDADLTSNP